MVESCKGVREAVDRRRAEDGRAAQDVLVFDQEERSEEPGD